MLRSDHDTVSAWGDGVRSPPGSGKQPPQGWESSRQLVGHGRAAVGDGDGKPVLGAAGGWSACTIEAPVGEDGVIFVIRTADKSHWVKDDGQDFMVYSIEARSNADVRAAFVKRRKEERTPGEGATAMSKSKKKSLAAGFVFVPEKVPVANRGGAQKIERRRHSHVAGCHRSRGAARVMGGSVEQHLQR